MARFNGSDYVPSRDDVRLTTQLEKIQTLMQDGSWRSLEQIASLTGAPPASVSAQLRHLRKPRFGGHIVLKSYCGGGLYLYQVA